MSLKTYKARDGETVYDMAIKLYNDARGVKDILLLNSSLNMESSTYFGQEITYDDSVIYKKETIVSVAKIPRRESWISRSGQTVFDLAIQIYGDINKLSEIVSNRGAILDPMPGEIIETKETDNFLANFLFSKKIVATLEPESDSDLFILRQTGEILLRQNGSGMRRQNG